MVGQKIAYNFETVSGRVQKIHSLYNDGLSV